MKVGGIGQSSGPSKTDRAKKTERSDKTGKSAFASHLDQFLGEVGEIHSADSPTPLTGVDSLLAAQSVDDATGEEARKRMVRRGEELLARLEELRHGMLMGHIPKERLGELAQMLRKRRAEGVDPRLAAIMDEIELRAEVELAKLARNR